MKNKKTALPAVLQIALCFFGLFLFSCSHKPAKTEQKTFVVHFSTLNEVLYYPGTVQPLLENALTSPVDGVLEKMDYGFGSRVKKDSILFTINSPALQKQYNDTLTEYLKAKDNFSIIKTKFIGTEDLWKAGLIAKNNYLSEKSNLNTAHVTLMQAWHALSSLLEQTGDPNTQDLSDLSLAEFEKVQAALGTEHREIQIRAPMNGVILFPPPSASETNTSRLSVGNTVKAGQSLASIGDLSGIRIEIDIPEVDIDKIKPNIPAVVSGVAFHQQKLQGKLKSITSQATVSSTGTLPSFQGVVIVNSLSRKQQRWIKIGMSAAVELHIQRNAQLMIPTAFVHLVNGERIVHVRKKDGTVKQVPIVTGIAKAAMVSVVRGLKNGDVLE